MIFLNMARNTTEKTDFFDQIQRSTENFLTKRRNRIRIKTEKQKAKSQIVDWLEAFLWAAGMVLLINQFVFQAYQIPSGSMIDTLLIGDRILVNKIIYGPEILPGLGKLPSPVKPKRNDIIIFENPTYSSKGAAFDIAQRVIFMLTLSFVDIDKDESGNPTAHFLIKRAVGSGGDRFISDRGNMLVRFSGEDRWVDESEYNRQRGYTHSINRLVNINDYPFIQAAGRAAGFRDLGYPVPPGYINTELSWYQSSDPVYERARLELLRSANPQDARNRSRLAKIKMGWYVPEGRMLPMGDNRDNSRDGRYFGPVKLSKILGRGSVIIWSHDKEQKKILWSRLGSLR